ncbi:MAG: twin-arginine translocation signal domain-containing protein, partial [Actinobacteria bacterium]|nr:twin-arginine translocation signal domain-containing protein [Actinomycetota bacterium]
MGDEHLDRRQFLRLAAAGAVSAAAGVACSSSGSDGAATKTTAASNGRATPKQLRIAHVIHYVPAYGAWFDNDYTRAWGDKNGVQVVVDHIPVGELPARAAAETASRKGHDLFSFYTPSAAFEDDVID